MTPRKIALITIGIAVLIAACMTAVVLALAWVGVPCLLCA